MLPPEDALSLANCDMWLDDIGVIRIVFKACPRHGLAEARALVAGHDSLAGGVKRGVLADLTAITTGADREARNYYVGPEASELKLGMAMITPSPFQRMLGNVFFRVNRPPYPSKMFQDEPSALAWLAGWAERRSVSDIRGESVGNVPEAEWTEQLARLADCIVAMARLDYGAVPAVPGTGPVAAIAAGLSALGEELEATVVAREEAEAANRAKSDFIANMSHELRTPLTTIVGTVSLLERTALDERQQRLLARIQAASLGLERLVSDVLDFSRLEAGKLRLERQPTELSEVLDAVLDAHQRRAVAQGLTVLRQPWSPPPGQDWGDGARLTQILHNLLENAIKYTPAGRVRVGVEHRFEGELAQVVVEVEDTGVGIPEDRLDGIFERFFQVDASLRRAQAGAGLGLSIAHALTESMGGALSVQSREGQGSTFRLVLSLASVAPPQGAQAPEPSPTPTASGPRILVVDDCVEIRELIGAMLGLIGHEPLMVSSGQGALDALAAQDFDLVLMDVQMPGMDGLETTRRALALRPGLQVVAVTAHSRDEDREACADAGMVDHLAKPFRLDSFSKMIQRHLAPEG